jgi:hypothetical protein
MSDYHFGETSYRNYIWVKGGASFHDPQAFSIQLSTRGAFRVEVYDGTTLVYTYRKKGQMATWVSLYFDGHGVDDHGTPILPLSGDYRFKLVNDAEGLRKARQGDLLYG